MKKLNLFFAMMGAIALLFYACSKDENTVTADEKASLSFGAIVQDLTNKAAEKQSDLGNIPACSDDAPSHVEIVLMQGDTEVVGSIEDPFRVDLVSGQVFTEEVPELQLDPGTYSLEHFSVYNSADELIWLAPKGGVMAEFVDHALPLSINLAAGVKKYVDVSVLCYDDRDVNQYGYQFFELDTTEAYEFCFFANYCPPGENDRHYVANYSVNIWLGTDDTGTPIYTDVGPVTGVNEAGDFYADPTCFVLPVNEDPNEPYLYYEVTLLDWPDNYGSVEPGVVLDGTLTVQQIMENFDGDDNLNYEHLRFNCDGQVPGDDSDDDGYDDDVDNCPNVYNPDQANSDGDSFGDACDNCPLEDNEDQLDSDMDNVGDVCDNCPEDANEDQADADMDSVGDVCDNCPEEANEDQADGDMDNVGDVCDNCPEDANEDQADADMDYIGDVCDNCPDVYNPNQMDTDGDGIGNACDQTPGGDNGDDHGDDMEGCETAIMYGDYEWADDLNLTSNRWGWTEHFENEGDGEYTYQIWAAAGQNILAKGYWVGNVILTVDGQDVQLEIQPFEGYEFNDIHVYMGDGPQSTTAPGQFDNTEEDDLDYDFTDPDGNFWFTVHVQVCDED